MTPTSGSPARPQMAAITDPSQMSSKPLGSSRRRRGKSPNGAGGVYYNQSTRRWMGRYTTEDPEQLPPRPADGLAVMPVSRAVLPVGRPWLRARIRAYHRTALTEALAGGRRGARSTPG